jgi:hypothetical protein
MKKLSLGHAAQAIERDISSFLKTAVDSSPVDR